MQKNTFLWITFFFFVPNALFSIPPTENAHGIIVKFKNTNKSTFKTREQLHAQMGTQLEYRPRRSPFDFVNPKSTDKRHDFAELTKLCDSYKANPNVADCEINYDLFARNQKTVQTGSGECALTPNFGNPLLKDGGLSPFWAQELSGSDLVAFPRNAMKMGVGGVRIALIDQGYGELKPPMQKKLTRSVYPGKAGENHGALSLGLLTGPVPFTLQAPVEVTHLFEVRNTVDYLKVMEVMEETKVNPAVIQIAVDLGFNSPVARDVVKRLAQKSILVAAASNAWPNDGDKNEVEFPGILVGSLTPEGYPSATSAAGANLTVSAPSDRFLQATADGKKAEGFGGTSGATALVASTVAAARTLVPDLTMKEAKQILMATATPTPAMAGGAGFGALNAVRFLAVVDRIRSQNLAGKMRDRSIASFPKGRLYNFEKEADAELTKAMATIDDKTAGCDARKMAYSQLRRAFFLRPSGKATEMLARTLAGQGLVANARFVENTDSAGLMAHLKEDIASPDQATRLSAARVAGMRGADGMDLLVQFAENYGRNPAAEGGVAVSTMEAMKGIAASMTAENRKIFAGRLRSSGNEDLEKVGKEIQ